MNLLMKFQFTVLFVAIFASATCWGKALQVQEVDLLMKIAEGASGLIIKTEKMPAMQRLEEFESILDASTYQGYKAAITEKKIWLNWLFWMSVDIWTQSVVSKR